MRRSKVPVVILAVTAAAFLAAAVHDLVVPLRDQYSTRAAVFAIEKYRLWVSPRLKGRVFCRFQPTCSAYGLESVKKYGAVIYVLPETRTAAQVLGSYEVPPLMHLAQR